MKFTRWKVAFPPLLPTGTYTYKFRYRDIMETFSEEGINISWTNPEYTTETGEITY